MAWIRSNNRAARGASSEEGFTLIEIMIVVLIIGILIAIAVPTFAGARTKAQKRAAESALVNALRGAKTLYADVDDYSTATSNAATGLPSVEPFVRYVDGSTASTGPNELSVTPGDVLAGDSEKWGEAVQGDEGLCYYLVDYARKPAVGKAGTKYASSATDACTGSQAFVEALSDSPAGGGW